MYPMVFVGLWIGVTRTKPHLHTDRKKVTQSGASLESKQSQLIVERSGQSPTSIDLAEWSGQDKISTEKGDDRRLNGGKMSLCHLKMNKENVARKKGQ
eukprot:SAG31_NODE_7579_length_1648_cov_2.867657_2_plen_97_part_01